MSVTRRFLCGLLLMPAIAGSLATAAVSAQSAGAPQLKAAFLFNFNFARFAEWPELPAGAPLVLCVLGDEQVFTELSSVVRGQTVNGRDLSVSRVSKGGAIGACQVLFVRGSEVAANAQLLESARALPVLTVSDAAGFAESHGVIELYQESSRMRFAVNLDAAQRKKLRLRSNLLAIAKIVSGKEGRSGGSRPSSAP